MDITRWYKDHFEEQLKGRYLAPKHIDSLLHHYRNDFEISVIGSSEKGKTIHCIKIGSGPKKVLGWSQMHGNESTTTKALFDLFKWITQKSKFQNEISTFLSTYTLYVVPILNPDGAELYTRENANGIDLNRDARDLSQLESRALYSLFEEVQPELCLNLHDQRSLYSLPNKKPATVSFLSPAANETRDITDSRKVAMAEIVRMKRVLQQFIPGQVGRYSDVFNSNCVGDRFQMLGVPTILFEAGHYPGDYQREKTREYIFYAFLTLFGIMDTAVTAHFQDYFLIPENGKEFKDVILRNVKINGNSQLTDIAINLEEVLEKDAIQFVPVVENIGNLEHFTGHREIDGAESEILLNSYENVFVGEKVATIVDKYATNRIFF